MHFAVISVLSQLFHGFLCMLLFLGDQYDFRGIVLKKVGGNAKADAGSSSSDNVDLK